MTWDGIASVELECDMRQADAMFQAVICRQTRFTQQTHEATDKNWVATIVERQPWATSSGRDDTVSDNRT